MSLKDFDQLAYEIDQAVHVNGPLGKTTAPGLNNLLKSLATELTTVPGAIGGTQHALAYSEALALQQAGELQPGAYYLIGDRPTLALGNSGEVIAQAVATDALAPEAILHTRVPDYAALPLWHPPSPEPGPATGTGYTQHTTTYSAITPHYFDAVDRHVIGDDTTYPIQLPFPFAFGGITYTECAIDTNGRIVFGSANYASVGGGPALGSSPVPMIAFAWSDLVVTAATFSTFVTGEAPYRKFVLDYNRARLYQRWIWGGDSYNTQDTTTGQLVLEETTNCISLGIAANSNPDQNVGQGLQYAGHAYPLYPGQALPGNVQTTFTPVVERAAGGPSVAPATPPAVVWRGQTWHRVADDTTTEEPGTGPAWALATEADADAYGNSRPAYDLVRYELASDHVAERRDAAGNLVRGDASLRGFPWGHPGVHHNQVLDCQLDDSLLTTPGLQLHHNVLVNTALTRVQLGGLVVHDNYLYHVTLTDYAPTSFDQVTAYAGLDQSIPGLHQQLFVNGQLVRDTLPALDAGLASFKDRYLDAGFITYRAGQAPSYAPLDVLDPFNTDYTAHDLIEIRGSFQTKTLCLRNQDYRICGNAIFGGLTAGAMTKALQLDVSGLTFLNGFSLLPASTGTAGHRHHYVRCTIGSLSYSGAGNGQLNTYTFSHCRVGRLSNLSAQPYQQAVFDNCVFGVGITTGAIFGGGRGAGNGPLVVANSTIVLQGAATLFDPGFDQTYAPAFENVTVVAADGTVSRLPGPPAGSGLEVVAQALFTGAAATDNAYTLALQQVYSDAHPTSPSGGWNQAESRYTVPVTGLYELTTKARLLNRTEPGSHDYALGAGSGSNQDEWLEQDTVQEGGQFIRLQTSRLAVLQAGTDLRPCLRGDNAAQAEVTLTIKLLQRISATPG